MKNKNIKYQLSKKEIDKLDKELQKVINTKGRKKLKEFIRLGHRLGYPI